MNFTDVDDKIIDRANRLGVDPFELAEKYIEEFKTTCRISTSCPPQNIPGNR
jgi:cysteinyl-tRNA synthetase